MIRFYGEDELVIAFMNGSDNYHYFPIDTAGFRKDCDAFRSIERDQDSWCIRC